jgi:hypothetical protein
MISFRLNLASLGKLGRLTREHCVLARVSHAADTDDIVRCPDIATGSTSNLGARIPARLSLGKCFVDYHRQPDPCLIEPTSDGRQVGSLVGIPQPCAGPDPHAGCGVLVGSPGGQQGFRRPHSAVTNGRISASRFLPIPLTLSRSSTDR